MEMMEGKETAKVGNSEFWFKGGTCPRRVGEGTPILL
jgi:hypothetical protein